MNLGRHGSRLLLQLVGALVACMGCRSRPATPAGAAGGPPLLESSAAAHSDPYTGAGTVRARHFVMRQSIHPPSPSAFARLDGDQRAARRRLIAKGALVYKLYASADRLLVELPANHPLGGMELLLADDIAQLVVFDRERWRYPLDRSRLPDILDLAARSTREEIKAGVVRPPAAIAASAGSGEARATDAHAAEISLRYRPDPSRAEIWTVRQRLLWRSQATGGKTYTRVLFQLPLPLLHGRRGQLVVESLAALGGSLDRYERSVANESFPDGAPVRFTGTIRDLGWAKLPGERFAAARPGYRLAGRFDTSRRAGAQLVGRTQLGHIRSGKPGGKLRLRNRSTCAALVFVDGVMVGWVGRGHEQAFTGLPRGYYRVFAASPSGVRSWGPRDLYLPGLWTLE